MSYLLLFLLVLFADQITKAIAFAVMGPKSSLLTWIPGFLGIDTTVNTGVSFGWFGDKPWAMPVFIAVTAVAIVVFFIFFIKTARRKRFLRVALVLIMAGAAGNLIDRSVMSGVRDLILHMELPNEAIRQQLLRQLDEAAAPAQRPAKVGRNDPCPCGSGKKYKQCCGK